MISSSSYLRSGKEPGAWPSHHKDTLCCVFLLSPESGCSLYLAKSNWHIGCSLKGRIQIFCDTVLTQTWRIYQSIKSNSHQWRFINLCSINSGEQVLNKWGNSKRRLCRKKQTYFWRLPKVLLLSNGENGTNKLKPNQLISSWLFLLSLYFWIYK